MKNNEIKNAVITAAEINIDRGLLTAWVDLDFGGSGQGFGGYALFLPDGFSNQDLRGHYCGCFVFNVLKVVGVEKWSDLKGKSVRVKGDYSRINAIGNIIKDVWFEPEKEFAIIEKALEKNK